jgi:hypothetical protein
MTISYVALILGQPRDPRLREAPHCPNLVPRFKIIGTWRKGARAVQVDFEPDWTDPAIIYGATVRTIRVG